MSLLIVPSGYPVRSAISWWVSPWTYAMPITWRGRSGRVAKAWHKVSVDGHDEQVLAALAKL